MPHLHRFHVPPDTPEGGAIALPEAEAHHALRVARLRAGEEVELFDGCGRVWRGAFEPGGKREAQVHVTQFYQEPLPPISFTLLQASLHRDQAMEEILRRGTEIGVTRFAVFKAARSEHGSKLSPKWERMTIEACKQCGRNRLPMIELVNDAPGVVRQHEGASFVAALTDDAQPVARSIEARSLLLAVGPEGDFSADEIAGLVGAGARPITLGKYTYRSEAAALLGATLLLRAAGAFA